MRKPVITYCDGTFEKDFKEKPMEYKFKITSMWIKKILINPFDSVIRFTRQINIIITSILFGNNK